MFRKKSLHNDSPESLNLGIESLEDRILLSADVTFLINGGGFLVVQGSEFDDVISIYDDGASVKIDAEYNGNGGITLDTGVTLGSLTGVRASGQLGNDEITIDSTMGAIKTFLYGNDGNDILNGGLGRDTLRGQAGADELSGGAGKDSLQFDEMDTVLDGGTEYDTAIAIDATVGINLVLNGTEGLERIAGSIFGDTIDASLLTDRIDINGKAGDDIISGGSGNDSLVGGDGNDSLFGNAGADGLLGGAGDNFISGGAGGDVLGYHGAAGPVIVNLTTGTASNGYGGTDTIATGADRVERVNGSVFGDTLTGSALGETLFGGAGDDTLIGLGGGDQLDGGGGTDTADYSASAAGVNVNIGDGFGSPESGGDAQGDRISSVENVIGSAFADILKGNGKSNVLTGGDGNDFLDGAGADDSLFGGNGNDTLFGRAGTDIIDGGADNDTVFADEFDDQAATFTGGTGMNTLKAEASAVAVNWVLTDASLFQTITGSNMGDVIDASAVTAYAMTISAAGGDDTVTGGAMGDTVNGGGGNDTIFGGLGGDILRGNGGDDVMYGNDLANTSDGARDRFFGGGGTDTVTGLLVDPTALEGDTIDGTVENDGRV